MANVEARAGYSFTSPAVLDDKENWTTADFVEPDAETRAGVKRRLYDLQESFRAKKRKVLNSILEAVSLIVELFDDAKAISSLDASSAADPRIDVWTRQLVGTKAGVIL